MVQKVVGSILVIGVALAGAVATGSEQTSKRRDKRAIKEQIASSPYFSYLLTGTTKKYGSAYTETSSSTSGASAASADSADTAAILPAGWGRKLEEDPVRTSTVVVVGDTATVSTVGDVEASLYVDTSFDGRKNPGVKPIEDQVYRYSTWVKENGKWHITEVSPAEARLANPSEQTVHITEVKVWVNDALALDVTDPSAKLNVDTGVVHVSNGDVVRVEAAVANTSTSGYDPLTFVFCHPNRPVGGRDLMYDDGVNGGDLIANDGVWTYTYTVNLAEGVHHAAVDALDSKCLQNETEDDYNSAAWGMPYVVEE